MSKSTKIDPQFNLVRTFTNEANKTFRRGQEVKLSELLGDDALWSQEPDEKGRQVHVIKHWALQTIAELSGLKVVNGKDSDGEWVQLGTIDNGMTFIKKYVIEDLDGKRYWAIGEANPQNSDVKVGLSYMADKRAYDRCVIVAMGLSGRVYSEDENEVMRKGVNKELEKLSKEDQEALKPFIEKPDAVKDKEALYDVGEEIKLFIQEQPITEGLKEALRSLYASKLAVFERSTQSSKNDSKAEKTADKKPKRAKKQVITRGEGNK